MKTADHLPTAVDFTNILLNYIEVSADSLPKKVREGVQQQQPQTARLPSAAVDVPSKKFPPADIHPPHILPPTPTPSTGSGTPDQRQAATSGTPAPPATGPASNAAKQLASIRASHRSRLFSRDIPPYLRSLESADNLSQVSGNEPPDLTKEVPAPSLPIMLSKVILNSSTPVKDDSSVLNIPNHVVLNHLATSSIKYGCLASSATTRYKRKFTTSIFYKPLREDLA
jgi:hypothetical protein